MMMNVRRSTPVVLQSLHVLYVVLGLLCLSTKQQSSVGGALNVVYPILATSTSSVWNMPWPVVGYKSYMNVMPMRYGAPAGLASLNFSFSGLKTQSSCPEKDIHIVIGNGGLPLVDLSENFLPQHFVVPEDPSIKLIIKPGQIAELSLTRPPPGPYYIVGYLKDIDSAIKQKGLHAKDSCSYLYMSMAKFSAPIESQEIWPGVEIVADVDTKGSLFRFLVPPSTVNFEVQVTSCDRKPCNLSLKHLTFLPKDSREIIQDCSTSENVTDLPGPGRCVLHVSSPALHEVQMIQIKYVRDDMDPPQNTTIVFHLVLQECTPFLLGSTHLSCGLTPPLDRIQSPLPLTTRFGAVHSSTVSLVADLSVARVTAIPFTITEPNDIGGTLKWQMRLIVPHGNLSSVQVCGGLLLNKLPDTSLHDLDLCTSHIPGVVNLTSLVNDGVQFDDGRLHVKRYVAYPQAGQWHIVLQSHCFTKTNETSVDCGGRVLVEMMLEIQECVDGECSGHGTCELSTTGTDLISFSVCQCDADYRGYGCSDSRHAQTMAVQLAGAYLLTFSNLFFLPAIALGLQRGFTLEAFVYLFNMFFSTFYHACDGIRLQRYRMCITDYDLLQLADFFGSACSLWFTLVAMARIRYKHVTGLLQIVGLFGLFVIVVYDRTSLCVIAVPIFSGLATITCSWGVKMYQNKHLYPSWRRYAFYLVPGVLLAVVGGLCFAYLETESNYKYLHSVWHTCVALSIVLLLPPRSEGREKYGVSASAVEMSQLSTISFSPNLS